MRIHDLIRRRSLKAFDEFPPGELTSGTLGAGARNLSVANDAVKRDLVVPSDPVDQKYQ